jgi:hypothetical protein
VRGSLLLQQLHLAERSSDACFVFSIDFDAEGSLMKGFLIAAGIIAALYVADQQYAQGKYTYALQHMANQMRHSFGI